MHQYDSVQVGKHFKEVLEPAAIWKGMLHSQKTVLIVIVEKLEEAAEILRAFQVIKGAHKVCELEMGVKNLRPKDLKEDQPTV